MLRTSVLHGKGIILNPPIFHPTQLLTFIVQQLHVSVHYNTVIR